MKCPPILLKFTLSLGLGKVLLDESRFGKTVSRVASKMRGSVMVMPKLRLYIMKTSDYLRHNLAFNTIGPADVDILGMHLKKQNTILLEITVWVYAYINRYLEPKACKMEYWGQKLQKRCRTRRTAMLLIDQFLFVLMRLKVHFHIWLSTSCIG